MKVFPNSIPCIRMNISPSEVFNRISSFWTAHTAQTAQTSRVKTDIVHNTPTPVKQVTFDQAFQAYLDKELDKYMSNVHSCTSCKNCWPSHKKTAASLLKLHPSLNSSDTPDDTLVSTPTLHNTL